MKQNITNINTLRIHKLTQEQYDQAAIDGKLEENALYLTTNENKIIPNISYGTADPSGGNDGDIYIQIVE